MKITTIGLDLSKSVFQIHGFDEAGTPVLTKRLRRKLFDRQPRVDTSWNC